MNPVAVITIGLAIAGLGALAWVVYLLFGIGFDTHPVGPWTRPKPPQRQTKLPADFIGLWSLFGRKSMRDYTGSWEAAVRRLDRLEASLATIRPEAAANRVITDRADDPPPAPAELSEDWLNQKLDRLEALAGVSTMTTHLRSRTVHDDHE